MKTMFQLTAVLIIFLSSCTSKASRTNEPGAEIPKPLQPDNSYLSSGKRGYDDLVNRLYSDLVSQSAELKALEAKLDNLNRGKPDSLAAFSEFNSQNEQYYNSAERHLENIWDSMLRKEMQGLVKQSHHAYLQSISQHQSLLKAIEDKSKAVGDVHEALKLSLTMDVMQQYQKDARPSTKPLEEVIRELDRIKKELDALKKKNGG